MDEQVAKASDARLDSTTRLGEPLGAVEGDGCWMWGGSVWHALREEEFNPSSVTHFFPTPPTPLTCTYSFRLLWSSRPIPSFSAAASSVLRRDMNLLKKKLSAKDLLISLPPSFFFYNFFFSSSFSLLLRFPLIWLPYFLSKTKIKIERLVWLTLFFLFVIFFLNAYWSSLLSNWWLAVVTLGFELGFIAEIVLVHNSWKMRFILFIDVRAIQEDANLWRRIATASDCSLSDSCHFHQFDLCIPLIWNMYIHTDIPNNGLNPIQHFP